MTPFAMQIITLDDTAQQALELDTLPRFDPIVRCEPEQLDTVLIKDHHPVLVLSHLSETLAQTITDALSYEEDPIVILPGSAEGSEPFKQLLLNGMRVFLAPSGTLTSLALFQILETLHELFFPAGSEEDIVLDPEEIYEAIPRGTCTRRHETGGVDLTTAMMRLFNLIRRRSGIAGAIFSFTVPKERQLFELAEAMELAELHLPGEAMVLFTARFEATRTETGTLVALISRVYDFIGDLQESIDTAETYLGKLAIIVDAFASGLLGGEEADILAERNGLDSNDALSLYTMVYRQPASTAELIRFLGDPAIEERFRIEAAADAVISESVPIDIVEALVEALHLPVDAIVDMIGLKQAGKLPLQKMELPPDLEKRFTHLKLARNANSFVLLEQSTPCEERDGLLSVDTTELKPYEKDGMTWYVSKNLSESEIDRFLDAYIPKSEKG